MVKHCSSVPSQGLPCLHLLSLEVRIITWLFHSCRSFHFITKWPVGPNSINAYGMSMPTSLGLSWNAWSQSHKSSYCLETSQKICQVALHHLQLSWSPTVQEGIGTLPLWWLQWLQCYQISAHLNKSSWTNNSTLGYYILVSFCVFNLTLPFSAQDQMWWE